jgi:hypothetical protein
VADQAVAFTGHAALYFSGRGEFEALLHTAFGLQLGHFGLLLDVRFKTSEAALFASLSFRKARA